MSYNNVPTLLKECAKPESYNFEFECDIEKHIALPAISRYLTYKAAGLSWGGNPYEMGRKFSEEINKSGNYRAFGDCDGCGDKIEYNQKLIHDVYSELWGWEKEISTIDGSGFQCKFGPDTLNSMQASFNKIVTNLIKKEQYEKLRNKKKGES